MARLQTLFPDREFIVRSQGQVRFFTVSSRMQLAAAALVAALLLVWIGVMTAMTIAQVTATNERIALLNREAKVASAESRVKSLGSIAADLARRQEFIEKVVETQIGELPADAELDRALTSGDDVQPRTIGAVGAALPNEAATLARIEARQFAFVENLTGLAERRAQRAEQALRAVGFNPGQVLATMNDHSAQGGPLLRMATSADGALDPRFRRLGVSLARMNALERGLAGIPQVLPASLEFISSGFGYRADPFSGDGAFHSGLDFKGPIGAPVYSAADGVVGFAGVRQGYGNCVEIDHGNGLVTRYAHLSAFRAAVGQRVDAGAVIGAIGSTGRSTGPHLHFEVRIHDRAVNPRPFLEMASHGRENAQSR